MNGLKLVLVFIVLLTLWFQRNIFFDSYDHEYLKEYYSHSQWAFVNSSRVMGDADLYSFAGYSLLEKYEPFSINPETPIFGKLFFGFSILLFNNPHIASLIFLIALLIGIDRIAKDQFHFDTTKRIILIITVFCSAEIQEQLKATLLDLPQVMLFVWHLVYLFKISKQKEPNKLKHILYAGILLGFMSATKAPIFTPFILLVDTWYLYRYKKIKYLLVLLITTIVGYIIPYIPTIVSDGVVQFLKSQKWILNFYLDSNIKAPVGMLLVTVFTGLNKGWTDLQWRYIDSWNGEWALGLLGVFVYIYNWIKTKKIQNTEVLYILAVLIVVILVLLKIPFWPRYMIFLLPFFWLLLLNYIQEKKTLVLLLIFPFIATSQLIVRSYIPPVDYIELWNKGAYEELYDFFSSEYRTKLKRKEFVTQSISEYENLQPYQITTKIVNQSETNGLKQEIALELLGYFGTKSITKEITWIREHSQWKISEIKNLEEIAKPINISVSAYCVNPMKVSNWSSVIAFIGEYYDISIQEAKDRTMQLVPREYCIPIGIVDKNKDQRLPNGMQITTNQSEKK